MRPHILIDIPSLNVTGASLEFYSAVDEINVSHASQAFSSRPKRNVKGFQLDLSPLDGSYTLFGEDGFEGYIGRTTSIISFKVINAGPTNIQIVFDTRENAYAETITFTVTESTTGNIGRTLTITNNNKVTVTINVSSLELAADNVVEVEFSDWSAEGESIKLERLNANYILEYEGDIINFVCSENLMDSNLEITPGVCEQYANIELYDRNSVLRELALEGKLHRDEAVYINVFGEEDFNESLGTWYVDRWDIEADSSRVKINCRDIIYRLDNIEIAQTSIMNRTVDDLLNLVMSQAPNFSWQYLDAETKARCENITIPSNWYNITNLRTILDKICVIGMLRIYWYNEMFYVGRSV